MPGDPGYLWAVRLQPFAAAVTKTPVTLKCQLIHRTLCPLEFTCLRLMGAVSREFYVQAIPRASSADVKPVHGASHHSQ